LVRAGAEVDRAVSETDSQIVDASIRRVIHGDVDQIGATASLQVASADSEELPVVGSGKA
jgi:hypothetical protein